MEEPSSGQLEEERETDAIAPVLGACRSMTGSSGVKRALPCSHVGLESLQEHVVGPALPEAKRSGKLACMMVPPLLCTASGVQKFSTSIE